MSGKNRGQRISRYEQDSDKSDSDARDVSLGDVSVGVPNSSAAASIITQVDRNGKTNQPQQRNEDDEETEYKPNSGNGSGRRTFAQRLLCCFGRPASGTARRRGDGQISLVANTERNIMRNQPLKMPIMPPRLPPANAKKCLALDLDETLVHSSFHPVDVSSFTINVTIEGIVHHVYVIKRPGVDEFLTRMAQHYELVIYTASLSKYANPLLDILDPEQTITTRLFREHCVFYDGHYVKDLSLLNRDIGQTIIVDNSAMSYVFHNDNAIDCSSFFDDPRDVELWQIADFLESIKSCDDVRYYCRHWREWCRNNPSTVPIGKRNGKR